MRLGVLQCCPLYFEESLKNLLTGFAGVQETLETIDPFQFLRQGRTVLAMLDA